MELMRYSRNLGFGGGGELYIYIYIIDKILEYFLAKEPLYTPEAQGPGLGG